MGSQLGPGELQGCEGEGHGGFSREHAAQRKAGAKQALRRPLPEGGLPDGGGRREPSCSASAGFLAKGNGAPGRSREAEGENAKGRKDSRQRGVREACDR